MLATHGSWGPSGIRLLTNQHKVHRERVSAALASAAGRQRRPREPLSLWAPRPQGKEALGLSEPSPSHSAKSRERRLQTQHGPAGTSSLSRLDAPRIASAPLPIHKTSGTSRSSCTCCRGGRPRRETPLSPLLLQAVSAASGQG